MKTLGAKLQASQWVSQVVKNICLAGKPTLCLASPESSSNVGDLPPDEFCVWVGPQRRNNVAGFSCINNNSTGLHFQSCPLFSSDDELSSDYSSLLCPPISPPPRPFLYATSPDSYSAGGDKLVTTYLCEPFIT